MTKEKAGRDARGGGKNYGKIKTEEYKERIVYRTRTKKEKGQCLAQHKMSAKMLEAKHSDLKLLRRCKGKKFQKVIF